MTNAKILNKRNEVKIYFNEEIEYGGKTPKNEFIEKYIDNNDNVSIVNIRHYKNHPDASIAYYDFPAIVSNSFEFLSSNLFNEVFDLLDECELNTLYESSDGYGKPLMVILKNEYKISDIKNDPFGKFLIHIYSISKYFEEFKLPHTSEYEKSFGNNFKNYVMNKYVIYFKNKWIVFEVDYKNKNIIIRPISMDKNYPGSNIQGDSFDFLTSKEKISNTYRYNSFYHDTSEGTYLDKNIRKILEVDSFENGCILFPPFLSMTELIQYHKNINELSNISKIIVHDLVKKDFISTQILSDKIISAHGENDKKIENLIQFVKTDFDAFINDHMFLNNDEGINLKVSRQDSSNNTYKRFSVFEIMQYGIVSSFSEYIEFTENKEKVLQEIQGEVSKYIKPLIDKDELKGIDLFTHDIENETKLFKINLEIQNLILHSSGLPSGLGYTHNPENFINYLTLLIYNLSDNYTDISKKIIFVRNELEDVLRLFNNDDYYGLLSSFSNINELGKINNYMNFGCIGNPGLNLTTNPYQPNVYQVIIPNIMNEVHSGMKYLVSTHDHDKIGTNIDFLIKFSEALVQLFEEMYDIDPFSEEFNKITANMYLPMNKLFANIHKDKIENDLSGAINSFKNILRSIFENTSSLVFWNLFAGLGRFYKKYILKIKTQDEKDSLINDILSDKLNIKEILSSCEISINKRILQSVGTGSNQRLFLNKNNLCDFSNEVPSIISVGGSASLKFYGFPLNSGGMVSMKIPDGMKIMMPMFETNFDQLDYPGKSSTKILNTDKIGDVFDMSPGLTKLGKKKMNDYYFETRSGTDAYKFMVDFFNEPDKGVAVRNKNINSATYYNYNDSAGISDIIVPLHHIVIVLDPSATKAFNKRVMKSLKEIYLRKIIVSGKTGSQHGAGIFVIQPKTPIHYKILERSNFVITGVELLEKYNDLGSYDKQEKVIQHDEIIKNYSLKFEESRNISSDPHKIFDNGYLSYLIKLSDTPETEQISLLTDKIVNNECILIPLNIGRKIIDFGSLPNSDNDWTIYYKEVAGFMHSLKELEIILKKLNPNFQLKFIKKADISKVKNYIEQEEIELKECNNITLNIIEIVDKGPESFYDFIKHFIESSKKNSKLKESTFIEFVKSINLVNTFYAKEISNKFDNIKNELFKNIAFNNTLNDIGEKHNKIFIQQAEAFDVLPNLLDSNINNLNFIENGPFMYSSKNSLVSNDNTGGYWVPKTSMFYWLTIIKKFIKEIQMFYNDIELNEPLFHELKEFQKVLDKEEFILFDKLMSLLDADMKINHQFNSFYGVSRIYSDNLQKEINKDQRFKCFGLKNTLLVDIIKHLTSLKDPSFRQKVDKLTTNDIIDSYLITEEDFNKYSLIDMIKLSFKELGYIFSGELERAVIESYIDSSKGYFSESNEIKEISKEDALLLQEIIKNIISVEQYFDSCDRYKAQKNLFMYDGVFQNDKLLNDSKENIETASVNIGEFDGFLDFTDWLIARRIPVKIYSKINVKDKVLSTKKLYNPEYKEFSGEGGNIEI